MAKQHFAAAQDVKWLLHRQLWEQGIEEEETDGGKVGDNEE